MTILSRDEMKRRLDGYQALMDAGNLKSIDRKTFYADVENLRTSKAHADRLRETVLDLAAAWKLDMQRDSPTQVTINMTGEDGKTNPHIMTLEIQGNDCSRLHKLADAINSNTMLDFKDELHEELTKFPQGVQTFVIKHDWSKVLDGEVLKGEYQLPYDRCAFEFRVSNRTVIVLAMQEDDGHIALAPMYESKTGNWMLLNDLCYDTWESMVRTVCVMLEAEVTVKQVTRVAAKLQAKRIKEGKLLMYDFHTVNLAPRHRTTGGPGLATGQRKRLHFCRGHWRHYETHKTWIKWCLKGDETLGFVDKDYRM